MGDSRDLLLSFEGIGPILPGEQLHSRTKKADPVADASGPALGYGRN